MRDKRARRQRVVALNFTDYECNELWRDKRGHFAVQDVCVYEGWRRVEEDVVVDRRKQAHFSVAFPRHVSGSRAGGALCPPRAAASSTDGN